MVRYFIFLMLILAVVLIACDRPTESPPTVFSPTTPSAESDSTTPSKPVETSGSEPVIIMQRSGGISGICQKLTIDSTGNFSLENCINDNNIRSGTLSVNRREQFSAMLTKFGRFSWRFDPPSEARDMIITSYEFRGSGVDVPPAREKEKISWLLAELAGELERNR